jgi:predicted PurR-regulated permease PerM
MAELNTLAPSDRRQLDRRTSPRIADLTLPEFRRIVITSTLFVIVLALFLWMVRNVIIAAILGVMIAVYLRPVYGWLAARTGHRSVAALLTLTVVVLPIVAVLAYSYFEIIDVAEYVATHEAEIAAAITDAMRRSPLLAGADVSGSTRRMVNAASNYGARIPGAASDLVGGFTVSAAVFLFTTFYVFTQAEQIIVYIRSKIPPRYSELSQELESNIRGVLYGAIYATLITQTIKSAVILAMNLLFGVPLAVVLAIVSFVIGFFPIVGSWSVYLPVAGWLLVFRGATFAAVAMLAVGFFVNTLFISMYLRPKMAADRSRVLNFYWMFLGLVTGVYTFGLAGILLGPVLIGMLKAVADTITTSTSWRLIETEEELIAAPE